MSILVFSARSDEGLRTCLRAGVAGEWESLSACAAAEAIAMELDRRFAASRLHTRGGGVPVLGGELLGQLWLHLRKYATTVADSRSPWAVIVTHVGVLASREAGEAWATLDPDLLAFIEVGSPRGGGSPDLEAGLPVDFSDAPSLERIVDGLVAAGAESAWARRAVQGVAEVAWRRGTWRRHREVRRAAGHDSLVGVSPLSARLLMDALAGTQTPSGPSMLERLALDGEDLTSADRALLRAVVAHSGQGAVLSEAS